MQVPLLLAYGLMTWQSIVIGLIAFIPLVIGVSFGNTVGKHINAVMFDRIILTMLAILAFKLVIDVYFGVSH